MPTETQQFTANGFGCCSEPHDYVWSDTCTYGDVDPVTGLFTTIYTLVGETCEVCVTDNANTDACNEAGSNCCAEVILAPGFL